MAVKFPIFVKSIECFHHEKHEEHKDFIDIFMSYLFLSKNFNLHRIRLDIKVAQNVHRRKIKTCQFA
jgi:hypothetical protein